MPPQSETQLPVSDPNHVRRFKELYLEHFGIQLSDSEAVDQLAGLTVIVRIRQMIRDGKDPRPL